MCMVSAVGDYFGRTIPDKEYWPHVNPNVFNVPPAITREEFDALKKDIEELKKMLVAAKRYDKATGQSDCEMEDKIALIKKLAKIVDVDLGDVFGD